MDKYRRTIILGIKGLIFFLISLSSGSVYATNYYVDFMAGSDGNDGKSIVSAWKNLTKVNSTTFLPGDSILLKYGSVWNNQQLAPKGSGIENNPIVISAYGNPDDGRPVLNGNGAVRDVVYLYNQEWVEILNLEITNFKTGDLRDDPASFKRGIYIVGDDCGELMHLYLINLYIHSVNGYGIGSNEGKNNGGIFFEILGTSVKSWFNDFLVENCHIYDIVRTGISNRSTWSGSSREWVPSHNIRIRNTIVERAGFNAMIPRYSDGTLVEYCTFIDNGLYGNGNAIFQTSSNNTIYQYNEAYGTVFNPDDHDAAGFDAGGYNNNTLIQYNYSHDNGLGGIVIGLSDDIPNDGARIRYNILQDNQRQAFRFSGPTKNATISNNTIYIGPELSDVNIIFHKKLGQSADNMSYYNNIFYVEGENCYYTFGESTKVSFSHNLFYGKHPSTEPEDYFKITDDPLLLAAGSGGIGMNTVDGYKLASNSPCINAGIAFNGNNGGYDFWGNSILDNDIPDIGAHEWQSSTGRLTIVVKDESDLVLEGAKVWMEGHDVLTTDINGEISLDDILLGEKIPLSIDYAGFPILAAAMEISSGDTVVFHLSKKVYSLRFIVKDLMGAAIENVKIGLIGHDTLYTNTQGELVFTDVTETTNILFKAELDSYKSMKSAIAIFKNDTLSIVLSPISLFFEIKDKNNADLKDVNISLGDYGSKKTDIRGVATFNNISKSENLSYTIDGLGYYKLIDSISVADENVSVLKKLEPIHLWFKVSDINNNPIAVAAVVLSDKLKWTNTEGFAEFTQIPSDVDLSYSVLQTAYDEATGTINLGVDNDTIYVILYPTTYNVNFTITNESENAIENAIVSLSGYGSLTSDTFGKVIFEKVEPKENIIFAVNKVGYRDTINVLNLMAADVFITVVMQQESGTGINKGMAESVAIYPSPASDFVTVNLANKNGKLLIYNTKSSLVYSDHITSNLVKIDISDWNNGLYILKMQKLDRELEIIGKLIVQR